MLYFFKMAATALVFFCLFENAYAQGKSTDSIPAKSAAAAKWFEKISMRGYAQFRYNRLLETNPKLKCEQCDRSIGEGQTFGFRRARLIFSGDVHPRMFVYLQFDYSADASSSNRNFLQVRDAYFDVALDKKKKYRMRFGQSKVPYGFENMQSSSNRLPLDRADALNSAAPNERDLGIFFMYSPNSIREKHRNWADAGNKGNGDYGAFTLGVYNGQTTNRPEQNNNLHVVARASYPFEWKNQVIEPGIQAYSGIFTIPKENLTPGVEVQKTLSYVDRRAAAYINVYPRPFGILAEYNIGQSPGFNTVTDSIEVMPLKGGFVTLSYKTHIKGAPTFPFIRYQHYKGPKKHELDARFHEVKEVEFGVECQIIKNLELTVSYVRSHRKFQDFKTDYDEKGGFLRVQLQAKY